jgi:N-acetylmuramoyl-L-alanine amidase
MRRKTVRRRVIRSGLLIGNIALLIAMLFFVLQSPHKDGLTTPAVLSQAVAPKAVANPLDQLSSANIAVNVARLTSVPEMLSITNQADSQAVELTQAPSSGNVITKPQVAATALKSKADIQTYKVKEGDTLPSIAAQFGVTSDSIRWSNNLSSAQVTLNQALTIPPVNGIVYTVKAGDTPESVAARYRASVEKVILFNDAENGLKVGEQIVIPDGTVQAVLTTAQVATRTVSSVGFAWGGNSAVYGGNGYAYGYCTWYVANRVPVPGNWGNANTWDNLAPASGWNKSRVPVPGAVAQTDAGWAGHVAVVEAVSEDGGMIKYSDMNGIAGWGRVGYSDWVPSSHFQWYIYR